MLVKNELFQIDPILPNLTGPIQINSNYGLSHRLRDYKSFINSSNNNVEEKNTNLVNKIIEPQESFERKVVNITLSPPIMNLDISQRDLDDNHNDLPKPH